MQQYKTLAAKKPKQNRSNIVTNSIKTLYKKQKYNFLKAAAAKSLQSCPTLCNPTDGSPPGSSIHGIFQAKTLEWVATAFSISESYLPIISILWKTVRDVTKKKRPLEKTCIIKFNSAEQKPDRELNSNYWFFLQVRLIRDGKHQTTGQRRGYQQCCYETQPLSRGEKRQLRKHNSGIILCRSRQQQSVTDRRISYRLNFTQTTLILSIFPLCGTDTTIPPPTNLLLSLAS